MHSMPKSLNNDGVRNVGLGRMSAEHLVWVSRASPTTTTTTTTTITTNGPRRHEQHKCPHTHTTQNHTFAHTHPRIHINAYAQRLCCFSIICLRKARQQYSTSCIFQQSCLGKRRFKTYARAYRMVSDCVDACMHVCAACACVALLTVV